MYGMASLLNNAATARLVLLAKIEHSNIERHYRLQYKQSNYATSPQTDRQANCYNYWKLVLSLFQTSAQESVSNINNFLKFYNYLYFSLQLFQDNDIYKKKKKDLRVNAYSIMTCLFENNILDFSSPLYTILINYWSQNVCLLRCSNNIKGVQVCTFITFRTEILNTPLIRDMDEIMHQNH